MSEPRPALPPTERRPIASGCRRYRTGRTAVVTAYDDDQFAEIRGFAQRQNCSFAEAVRLLCEWGLEAEELGTTARKDKAA